MMKRGHDVESAPSIWRWRTAVEHYAGIDVSLELSSVCVVDGRGKVVKEAKVASEPDALASFFKGLGFPVKLIGLEAGPLSQWLDAPAAADGMVPAGARQIDWIAGDSSAAGCAQAASGAAGRCGIEHSGNPAGFRPEDRAGDPQDV